MEIPERSYWLLENAYRNPSDRERVKLMRLLKCEEAALPWPTPEAQAS